MAVSPSKSGQAKVGGSCSGRDAKVVRGLKIMWKASRADYTWWLIRGCGDVLADIAGGLANGGERALRSVE